jgi:hypothetical protein
MTKHSTSSLTRVEHISQAILLLRGQRRTFKITIWDLEDRRRLPT